MKFQRWARAVAAVCVPAGVALTLCSCGGIGGGYTVDYLYVVAPGVSNASPSNVSTFAVNNQIGGLSAAGNGAVTTGGNGAVAAVATHDGKNVYIANQASGTVAQFTISQSSGSLSSPKTVSTPGGSPVALAVDLGAKYLFVVDNAVPAGLAGTGVGGAVSSYTIGSDGSLTLVSTQPVGLNPAGVATVSDGSSVYVTAQSSSAQTGIIQSFTTGSDGSLTPAATVSCGVTPTGVTIEPTDRFLYTTDKSQSEIIGFSLLTNGSLTQTQSSPYLTEGTAPVALAFEPRGRYLYAVNSVSGTISSFSLAQSNGALNNIGTPLKIGPGPVAVVVDPLQGQYVYTANSTDNSVSAFKLDTSTGTLAVVQNSPFVGVGSNPVALAAAPNGTAPTPGQP